MLVLYNSNVEVSIKKLGELRERLRLKAMLTRSQATVLVIIYSSKI
jgi:hypothetical protein